MRFHFALFITLLVAPCALGQQPSPAAKPPERAPSAPPETETIQVAPAPPSPLQKLSSETGGMDPAALREGLHKMAILEYRINDLLSQVQPAKWKISDGARKSFEQTLDTLRKQLAALEEWRAQFDKRPESMYLGYKTYVTINMVLPRLDGVARSVSQYENPSLGAQYSQAGNQLFDQQQAIEPYLSFLLRNQDGLLLGSENNLAACQNQLGYAMRGRGEQAIPMKNINPKFKGRRVRKSQGFSASAKVDEKAGQKNPAGESSPGASKPDASAAKSGDKK